MARNQTGSPQDLPAMRCTISCTEPGPSVGDHARVKNHAPGAKKIARQTEGKNPSVGNSKPVLQKLPLARQKHAFGRFRMCVLWIVEGVGTILLTMKFKVSQECRSIVFFPLLNASGSGPRVPSRF